MHWYFQLSVQSSGNNFMSSYGSFVLGLYHSTLDLFALRNSSDNMKPGAPFLHMSPTVK